MRHLNRQRASCKDAGGGNRLQQGHPATNASVTSVTISAHIRFSEVLPKAAELSLSRSQCPP